MVLSDRTIRAEIESGRIEIDPYDPGMVQPSSIDVRVDRQFRVFHNARYPYIDVRKPQDELTELVTIEGEGPFILHPGEFVLGQTLERVRLPDDLVARLEGKALALDTRVPTMTGWKRMGEIERGDLVFDLGGNPIPVVEVSEVMEGRPCREVSFSDGTTVIADACHRWVVQTKYDRKRRGYTRVLTTDEIGRSIKCSPNEYAYHVPIARPMDYEYRELLPIDPYVLGIWIGDGTSTQANVTTADQFVLDEIERCGERVSKAAGPLAYRVGGTGHTRDACTGRYTRNDSLSSRLRNLELIGNKHIPREYMQASIEQRQALLEGLMDSDGYFDVDGRCDLTTVKEGLAVQYRELIASLGFRPAIAAKPAKLYGKDCGTRYEVTFTPHRNVFRLPRKRTRQELCKRGHRGRAITGVREVPSVPVRCIEVGTPDGTFVITDSFIGTHNSSLGRLGLLIHSTAGFIDAGFEGNLTLELSNVANLPITIYHGMPIGQISFMRMDGPVETPYGRGEIGSKYHGQAEPTPSKFHLNFG